MTTPAQWSIVEPDLDAAFDRYEYPLEALAAGTIPAIVLRNAYDNTFCQMLVERLIAEELLYDPRRPIPAKFAASSIPEGYYREGQNAAPQSAWEGKKESGHTRIDIGSSLGYRGADKEAFLAHARESQALFDRLFDGLPGGGTPEGAQNPIQVLYRCLERLAQQESRDGL